MAIVSGFNHASFTVSDMDRSLAFYRDFLGMTLEADRELQAPHISRITGFPGTRMWVANLRVAGLMLELIQSDPDGIILEFIQRPQAAKEVSPWDGRRCCTRPMARWSGSP